MTSQQLVTEQQVPMNIKGTEARPVGRFGLNLVFSDQHGSGIFIFNHLRELGQPL